MSAHVCVFPGEDAAPEAVAPAVDLLGRLDLDLELSYPPVADHASELADGKMPAPIGDAIDAADVVLFGAARTPGYVRVLTYLRTEYGGGLPANVRPVRYLPGAASPLADPDGVDYVIGREAIEGVYVRGGAEGDLAELAAGGVTVGGATGEDLRAMGEGTYALRVATVRNLRRFATALRTYAQDRFDHRPVRLTAATKSNVLPRTDGLFEDVVAATAEGHDDVVYEHLHADHVGELLVADPGRFDVVATPNAAGDLLSDVGAGTVGGLGVAPSGCIGGDAAYFEPVHGTAPDIAGEGTINPTATILSAAMLLDFLDRDAAADRLRRAVESVYAAGGPLTPDQGGDATTTELADAVASNL